MIPERAFTLTTSYLPDNRLSAQVDWRAGQSPDTPKAHLAYNWEFDQIDRRQLAMSRRLLPAEEFQRRTDQLNARIAENLKSEIRERFCTLEYQTTYTLQAGQLVNELHDEPFSQIIKRGIVYRQKNGSKDRAREQAELIGFEQIEQIMNQDSEPKTIISFSPRGDRNSVYRHNFFDVFQKQADGQIQMTRFTSTASLEDFQKASQKLNSTIPQPVMVSDAYFLAHPIETTATLGKILETIELDNNAMEKEYVESIIEVCLPVILAYVNNPSEDGYKATINLADILAGKSPANSLKTPSRLTRPFVILDSIEDQILSQVIDFTQTIPGRELSRTAENDRANMWNQIPTTRYPPDNRPRPTRFALEADAVTTQVVWRAGQLPATIDYLASLPVRPVATGCGISGLNSAGTSLTLRNSLNPWSVADFGLYSQEEDKSDFPCPRCGETITYGAGIKQCPGCGLEATCA